MVGKRVSHCWCIYVVGHGYGWYCGGGVEVVDGVQSGQMLDKCWDECWETPEHFLVAR